MDWNKRYGDCASGNWERDAYWYETEHAAIVDAADARGVPFAWCISAIACFSSNSGWAGNKLMLMKALAAMAAGVPADANAETLAALHIGIVYCPKCKGTAGCETPCSPVRKGWAALHGDATAIAKGDSYKTLSFARNLMLDFSVSTIDRWARCAALGHPHRAQHGDKSSSCGIVPTGAEYAAIAEAYTIVAARLGMQSAAHLQAAVWCRIAGYSKCACC